MVRPWSCQVIYYFDTPALEIRHKSFDHVTHLDYLPLFSPCWPATHHTHRSVALPAPPKQPHRSPPLSATIPTPPSPAHMPPFACFSNDYYAGTSSPPLELHISRSVTTANSDSTTGSPTSVTASSILLIDSPAGPQLFVDLSSYPLQQLPSSDSSAA